MSNQWFRFYYEFAFNAKTQMLSEVDQRRYVMLLCVRCSNGDVTLHDSYSNESVAFTLRISNEQWLETKANLIAKGLIDAGNLPIGWDKRQYVSDSSVARVAAHRAKKKSACNVTETLQKQKCNVLDTDTDTDPDPDPDTERSREKDLSQKIATTHIQAEPKQKKAKPQPMADLSELPESVAQDLLTLRKQKKAPLTQTAWDGLKAEMEAGGYSPEQGARIMCHKGWQGFNAAWISGSNNYGKNNVDEIPF